MNQYDQLNVSSQKKDVHAAIEKLDKGLFANSFCKISKDIYTDSEEHCLVGHGDGTGTKSSLGYLYWKETGDLSVFKNLAIDAIVMNTDDMMCVGAIDRFTFSQIIGRSPKDVPGEVIKAVIEGTQDFFRLMKQYGITIDYQGGETADIGDLVRTLTIDAVMQTRMRREDVIEVNIQPGNVIVGLASFGQAVYENEYNSGIGSNGLTMARHKLFSSYNQEKYPETYDGKNIPAHLAYSGKYRVDSMVKRTHTPLGKFVLSPTRTYLPIMRQILETDLKKSITGIIHCTGGGQTKVLNFIDNLHIIKDKLFSIPEIFLLIQKESGEEFKEMYRTFNMGHRLEIYCDKNSAKKIIDISKRYNVEAKIIGYVAPSKEKKLTIESPVGTFVYDK